MLKVFVPGIGQSKIGGGWSFLRNFLKGAAMFPNDVEIVASEDVPHDICFAFAPNIVDGETLARERGRGSLIIVRVDGIPEDSRNDGKGIRRLFESALAADIIIYQSNFVQLTVGRLLKAAGITHRTHVVANGVDTDVFRPDGYKLPKLLRPKVIGHMAYRKDNNKRVEEVVQMFRNYSIDHSDTMLLLIGRYPSEWQDYNMGFFNNEPFTRLGIQPEDEPKAMALRSCHAFFYPAFADPAPNTVLEAMACGLPVIYQEYGGVGEYVGDAGIPIDGSDCQYTYIERVIDAEYMRLRAVNRVANNFTIRKMIGNYLQVFEQSMIMKTIKL